ncbi:MAG: amino acid adenylation domain-containing protein [Bacteroidota bacterium]
MIYLLPHTLLESAEKYPDAEAFRFGNQSLAYAELANQAQKLASVLKSRGVEPGDRVGILLNRCLESAIAIYGAFMAGAAYVPMNPRAPVDDLDFQLRDCGIRVLISSKDQKRVLAKLGDTDVHTVIGFKNETSAGSHLSWEDVYSATPLSKLPRILSDDLAYIMYTSGSTGRPKGIMHTHHSGLSFTRLAANLSQLKPGDRLANHAPLYFDISTFAYFCAPFAGATTCLTSDAHTIFPASLVKWMADEKINVWYSVPLALIQMIQSGQLDKYDLSHLQQIWYAGEACPPKYIHELLKLLPHTRVSNLYGPAETNVCTYHHIDPTTVGNSPIPIGRCWGDTYHLILDDDGQELEGVAEGVLYIRSSTMMQGYWQRPRLTNAAFYEKEYPGGITKRFYRTGDVVSKDESNKLHFKGRVDHQVKIRGYRVEIAAIEHHISSIAATEEVVVLAESKDGITNYLHALVKLKPKASVDENELLRSLKDLLPWYAIPEKLTFVSSFARTGSGKIDRRATRALIVPSS